MVTPGIAGTECIEEAAGHDPLLDYTLGPVKRVLKDGLGGCNRTETTRNLCDRFVPADRLELSGALGAAAAQGLQ